MEYFFEEPSIRKVKVEIAPCPCCGSEKIDFDKRDTGNGCDRFGGIAYIECQNCHHKVKRVSDNIGWGDTLEGLFDMVLAEWNEQSRKMNARDNLLAKALAVALGSDEFKTAHVDGDALVWIKPDGRTAVVPLTDIKSMLDKRRGAVNARQAIWLNGDGYEYEFAYCSECGHMEHAGWYTHQEARENISSFHDDYRYCPRCGAEMTGGEYVERKKKHKGKDDGNE